MADRNLEFPVPLHFWQDQEGGGEVGNEGVKLSLGRMWGRMERKCFNFCLCSPIQIGNTISSFYLSGARFPVMLIGK